MEEAPVQGEEVLVVSEDGVEKGGDHEMNEEKDLITLEDSETESSNTFAHKKRSPVGRGDEPSLGSLPNKRKRNTPNRFDPAAPATPAKKMSSKEASATGIVTPETARVKQGERRQSRAESQLNMKRYEDAKKSLCAMPETTEEEVVAALQKVGPPYGLQTTFHAIEHARRKAENWTEPKTERFVPHVGMRIRKVSDGKIYFGTVTQDAELCRLDEDEGSRAVQMWEVTFDGGDGCVDDMDWHEVCTYCISGVIESMFWENAHTCFHSLYWGDIDLLCNTVAALPLPSRSPKKTSSLSWATTSVSRTL